jgi:hypothetical protein
VVRASGDYVIILSSEVFSTLKHKIFSCVLFLLVGLFDSFKEKSINLSNCPKINNPTTNTHRTDWTRALPSFFWRKFEKLAQFCGVPHPPSSPFLLSFSTVSLGFYLRIYCTFRFRTRIPSASWQAAVLPFDK